MTRTGPQPSGIFAAILRWADQTGNIGPRLRPLHFIVRLFCIVFREFNANSLLLRSGALTYTVLLSLVPILAMSTSVIKGFGGGDQLREIAYSYIATLEQGAAPAAAENQPPAGDENQSLASHLHMAVDKLFDYVDRTNFATLGTIGVAGMLISVVLVLSNIEAAMNSIWKVPAGRSIPRKIADYVTLLILLPISINIAFAASAFLKTPALAARLDLLIPLPFIQSILLKTVPVLFIAVTLYIMFIFFPNTKVRTMPAVLGALFSAVVWFTVQNLYISLQVGVANYNAIYGSFATLPLFLVWIFLGWMFILLGAQLAYGLQNYQLFQLTPLKVGPALQLAAAFDLMNTLHDKFQKQEPVKISSFQASFPGYPAALTAKVLEELEDAGLLHISQRDDRLLPAAPYDANQQQAIIQAVFGSAPQATSGGKLSRTAIVAATQAITGPPPEKQDVPDRAA